MLSWCVPGQPVSPDLLLRVLQSAGLQLAAPETPGAVQLRFSDLATPDGPVLLLETAPEALSAATCTALTQSLSRHCGLALALSPHGSRLALGGALLDEPSLAPTTFLAAWLKLRPEQAQPTARSAHQVLSLVQGPPPPPHTTGPRCWGLYASAAVAEVAQQAEALLGTDWRDRAEVRSLQAGDRGRKYVALCSASAEDAAAMAGIARSLGGLSLVLCMTEAGFSWHDPLQGRSGTGKDASALLEVLQALALNLSIPPGFLCPLPALSVP